MLSMMIENVRNLAELPAINLDKDCRGTAVVPNGNEALEAVGRVLPYLLDPLHAGRQGGVAATPDIQIGAVTIDSERQSVVINCRKVHLTKIEFKLLHTLAKRIGMVQSHDLLLRDVWGYRSGVKSRTVDTHMARLRSKMGAAGKMIKTLRGFGYRMDVRI